MKSQRRRQQYACHWVMALVTAGFPETTRRCRRCHLEFRTVARNTKFCPSCRPAVKAETASSSPRNCLRSSRIAARCDTCGAQPDVVHNPMTKPGFYCALHCPVCQPTQASAQAEVPAP